MHYTKAENERTYSLHWLHTLPEWLKPIITTLVIGLVGISIRISSRHVYAQILVDLDNAILELWAKSGSCKSPGMVIIPDAQIFKHTRWPVWLIKRAKNYQRRKEKLKSL